MTMDRRTLMATGAIGLGLLSSAQAAEQTAPTIKFKRGYTDGPYGQIHYRYVKHANSTKTPLICLHASPLSGIVFETWLEEMGKDRAAYAPDTPGYGSSDTPPSPVQIKDFAAAMIRFMDELKIERADLMGYHTGSMTAVEMAKNYPNRVRELVLISAPIFTKEELVPLMAPSQRPAPTFEQMLDTTLNNVRKRGVGMFTDVPHEDRYWDISLERMRHYRTGTWGHAAAFNYDLKAALPSVKQPMLVLNPQDDLWEQTPRAKPYLNAQSRIHDLPGRTHGMLDSHAPAIAAVVRGFLDT